MFNKFESNVFTNAKMLKVREVVSLLSLMCENGSPELIELFDKIIGNNIYDVQA